MGLLDDVNDAISIAFNETADLQAAVLREAYTGGQNTKGEPNRSAAVSTPAIVEMKQQMVRLVSGELVGARAKVTFLDPAVVINLRDKLTLPDGTSGPILNVAGFVDRVTGRPVLSEVYLGL